MFKNDSVTYEQVLDYFAPMHQAALAKIASYEGFERNIYTMYGELVDNRMQLWYAHGENISCHVVYLKEGAALWVLAVLGKGFFKHLKFLSECCLESAKSYGCNEVRATFYDPRVVKVYARVGFAPLYQVMVLK